MKKTIRLTESDLARIVKKIISEQENTLAVDLTPSERTSELKLKDEQIKQLEDDLKKINSEIRQARVENILEKKNEVVNSIKQTIASIDKKIDNYRLDKKENKLYDLKRTKSNLEYKLKKVESGEGRTPEEKKEMVETLKTVAITLGVYISGVVTFIKRQENKPN